MKKMQKGFTLVELMIVVAIIGILAAIAIPKFAQMLEKSREGATKGNISAIKSAISIYYGDHEGVYPEDLTATHTATRYDWNFISAVDGTGGYMASLPKVKVTGANDKNPAGVLAPSKYTDADPQYLASSSAPTQNGTAWVYDNLSGNIWVNSTLLDSKGVPYSRFGYE